MRPPRIHLVRHGEVHNPDGVLYGQLPNFRLSERGARMAALAADDLKSRKVPATRLVASPLQRTQESASPIAEAFDLEPILDERVIEPWNDFEGKVMGGRRGEWRKPANWSKLARPWQPSWGEPYRDIVARMREALLDHLVAADGGDVIVVSHQLPIWMVHRALAHETLMHNPSTRRCSLSSITGLEYHPATGLLEVEYREPAKAELIGAVDQGAV